MKTKIFKNTIMDTMLLASAFGIAVAIFAPKGSLARADNPDRKSVV